MLRCDDLQNGYKIIQNTDHFCFGTDAVLLADFCKIRPGENVVEFCSGNGIIPILTAAKYNPGHITAFEIQKDCAALAQENMRLNGLEELVDVICDDIKNIVNYKDIRYVDAVVCNPPYMKRGGAIKNESEAKLIARHEIFCDIPLVFECAAKILRFGGRLCIIHKADRFAELITEGKKRAFEAKLAQFVHMNIKKDAKLVLCEFALGGKSQIKILPPVTEAVTTYERTQV